MYRFFCLLIISYFFYSCSKPVAFVAKAPEENSEKLHLTPEISEVSIPVELSVPGLEASINKQFFGQLYEGNQIEVNENIKLDIKVSKNSPIKLDIVGNDVIYNVPLKIWTNTFFKTSILGIEVADNKESECAIELQFKSKVSVDSLWKVQTKTDLINYNWIKKPVIKIGAFELPLGFLADYMIKNQKETLVKLLDDQVKNNLDVKPYLLEAWNKLQDPIMVTDSPKVWLQIRPIKTFMTPFVGKTGKLFSFIGISAYVESKFGSKPIISKSTLPNLQFIPQGPDQFSISLIGEISYEKLTELGKNTLKDQVFEFQDGKYKVKVVDMEVYPAGEKLAIKTTLAGSLNGIVYLSGIPVFDSTNKELKLIQTKFDIDTKNKLQKTAAWLMHGMLEKKMESSLHYSLASSLKYAEDVIRKSLTQNRIAQNIVLDGKLTHLSPKNIVLTANSVKTIVNAKGQLHVKVDGF
jgi:hypothetical protein